MKIWDTPIWKILNYKITPNQCWILFSFKEGVSPNIIEASFKALIDSLEYKLFKEKAPANIHEK